MKNKKKIVITYGSFDLLHIGHINILKRAKALGDYLIVGVCGEQYDMERGKLNVEESLHKRMENVKNTGFADQIIVEAYEGQKISDVQKYGADIFAIGSDWKGKFDYLKEYCKVVYLPRTPNISSTQVRNQKHKTIKIGIVGSGRIAKRFIPEAKFVSGCEVTGICSRDKKHAEEFAKTFELDFFTDDFDKLIQNTDAIYIATPHKLHYEMSRKALLAGKHVLCEKPITLKRNELIDLFDLADKKNLVIMEGIKTAYLPGFIRLIEVAKSGIIGTIKDVDACFTKIVTGDVRELDFKRDGGSVNELATYPLSAIIQLLGKPKKIDFYSYIDNNIDLYTKGVLQFPKAIATFKVGLGVKSEGELIISGTNGYIHVPAPWWLTQEFEVRFENQANNKKHFYKFYGEGLRYELAEFVKLIRENKAESWKLKRKDSLTIAGLIEEFNAKKTMEEISTF